jgi:hypothetical protein
VELGDKLVGDSVMSWCGGEIEVSDDFADFREGDCGVFGGVVVVSCDEIWWERLLVIGLWWEECVAEDITFVIEVIYAI